MTTKGERATVRWQDLAAANNAQLCDAVAHTHSLRGVFTRDAWRCPARTPMLYPDVVTLVADVSAVDLLARIDNSPGASIKDSYASLDLSSHGYKVLFDARWIMRRIDGRQSRQQSEWSTVETADDFAAWEIGWRGKTGPADVLLRSLLTQPGITIARKNGTDEIAGAIFNRSDEVVGISNTFASGGVETLWQECADCAGALFGAVTLVGYESGAELDAALACGFTDIGPLRVWVR
jgi:hypothetical protein